MTDERTLLRGRIPKHFIDQLDAWEDHGVAPSGILRRLLASDLFGTFELALSNPKILGTLPDLVVYVANQLPSDAWGTAQTLAEWRGRQNREH